LTLGVKHAAEGSRQVLLEGLRHELDSIMPPVQQVMRQTQTRVFVGDTHAGGKIVSLFEPITEVIRKGKCEPASKRDPAGFRAICFSAL
jgi:IS5 family transposase